MHMVIIVNHSKVYKPYVLYYNYVLIQNKMQIYQRVFLITSRPESLTATSFVPCLLVLSCDLFSLKGKGKQIAWLLFY